MLIIVAALDFALDFSLTELEDAMEALSAFFTVVTIIVGGTWTYLLFVRGRQKYPRATLEHGVMHKHTKEHKVLLRVTLTVSNQSDVLLSLVSGFTRVQRMLTWPSEFLDVIEEGKDPVEQAHLEGGRRMLGDEVRDRGGHSHHWRPHSQG